MIAPFVPPRFAVPQGRPGPLRLWRSIREPMLGWSKDVFEGGVYRSAVPGAPLAIGDPALAAEMLIERSEDFPHGDLLNRLFAPIWGRGIFVAEGADWRWQRRAASPAFRRPEWRCWRRSWAGPPRSGCAPGKTGSRSTFRRRRGG